MSAARPGMLTPTEARDSARSKLSRSHRTWTLDECPCPAFSLGLKPPTERTVLADLPAAQAWVRQWRQAVVPQGVEVQWEERTWRSVGRQQVPVRVTAHTVEALTAWVGGAPAREQRVFAQRVAAVRDRAERWARSSAALHDDVPTLEAAGAHAVAPALRRHAQRLTDMEDQDFLTVIDVVDWLQRHPVAGLRPRQLPIRGVDSKWFGRHRTLLESLAAPFLPSPAVNADPAQGPLGVVDAHPTVRLRVLDPRLRPAGLRDLEVPAGQAAAWDVRPDHVLFVENSETLLCLPEVSGGIAVWSHGFDTTAASLPWLEGAELTYWGDLDSQGFAILHRYRMRLPQLRSLLMDVGTLELFRDLWVPEPTPARGVFSTLASHEARALERLREAGDVRLEQERIPWTHALEALAGRLPVLGSPWLT